jgi:hypothetical protein
VTSFTQSQKSGEGGELNQPQSELCKPQGSFCLTLLRSYREPMTQPGRQDLPDVSHSSSLPSLLTWEFVPEQASIFIGK